MMVTRPNPPNLENQFGRSTQITGIPYRRSELGIVAVSGLTLQTLKRIISFIETYASVAWFWNHKKHQYIYVYTYIYVVIRSGLTLETLEKHM